MKKTIFATFAFAVATMPLTFAAQAPATQTPASGSPKQATDTAKKSTKKHSSKKVTPKKSTGTATAVAPAGSGK